MAETFEFLHPKLVEWVYDQSDEPAAGGVDLAPFAGEHGLDGPRSFALLRYCVERRYLDDTPSTMGRAAANLTPYGADWVRERRRRRNDPILRATTARTGLLKWLWKKKQEGSHMPVVEHVLRAEESLIEDDRLRAEEIDRASEYLHDKGLIKGISVNGLRGPVRAETTPEGDDCVEHYEGDVGEYERRRNQTSGTVFNIGSNTGNIAANSREFTMNATTNNGVDAASIVMFARALRQAAPVLGLPDEEALELTDMADRMEREAENESPDPSRIKRWGGAALGMLNSPLVSGALGSVLAAYGTSVLPGLS